MSRVIRAVKRVYCDERVVTIVPTLSLHSSPATPPPARPPACSLAPLTSVNPFTRYFLQPNRRE